MSNVQFNQPMTLAYIEDGEAKSLTCGKGVHPVPAAAMKTGYFESLKKEGIVVVLKEEADPTPDDLLDGNITKVKAGLAGLSLDELTDLRTREEGGKTRDGVIKAIDEAINNIEVE